MPKTKSGSASLNGECPEARESRKVSFRKLLFLILLGAFFSATGLFASFRGMSMLQDRSDAVAVFPYFVASLTSTICIGIILIIMVSDYLSIRRRF